MIGRVRQDSRLATLLLAILLAAGCQRVRPDHTEPIAIEDPQMNQQDVAGRFDDILAHLWDQDEPLRESGTKELADFERDTKDPGSQVGLKALRAAARPYPFDKPAPGRVSAELVSVTYSKPHPEYIPVVVELFEKFSDQGKCGAQFVLTELSSRDASEAFMTLVRNHAPTGKLPQLVVSRLVDNPRHADIFFPEILKYAGNPKLASEIYRLCLAYCDAKLIPPATLVPFTDQVLKSYAQLADKLWPAQKDQGIAWMWDDNYQE
jgi:hypothetical protein